MRSGALDRRITIESLVLTKNSFREDVETWTPLATVWAQAIPLRGTEQFQSEQFDARRFLKFRIRYTAGMAIDETCRIRHDDGELYDITSVTELGRREGREILAYAHVPA